MLQRIYGHLDTSVTWEVPATGDGGASDEPGEVAVSFYPSWGFGSISVEQPGSASPAEIRRAWRDLCDLAGAEAVYLELSLARPETPALCSAAESAGFFFAGLGPQFAPDGDVLRLQFLNTALDTSQIQLLDPFAKELLAYIDSERARVG
jgi:serine/threonine-protein kinase RsbW